ncbi:PP2C family protein-serine/threonine phosphatase [Kitasatospora sp. A2-31]|uniref:PP2C family protein-serine/threonine phosphatase n=1 Tax=Kitasatospora sp. A2-31 TaxID=2916414 RepID=UPI001EE9C9AC|nr:PP2C family protein-serine/threonine phosphatase [Kitasatospora sp. A2-31]MCG6495836.1 serine/threonine-protein phosphatase [Kitasatospora sp. A2-31]
MPLRQRPRDRRPSWRPDRRALTVLPLALIAVISIVDVLAPSQIHLGPLLIVAPAITASFAGARATTVVALLSLAALTVIGILREGITTANHETQLGALIAVSALIVGLRVLRDRHERELAQVRTVSEAAQRVLLRPLPDRIGPLHLASVYLAAEAEAQVGGDLYAAARTAGGTRLLVGDVRGKGLSSLGDAALLLGAFRAAAHLHADLPELAGYLDGSVCWDLAQLGDQDRYPDGGRGGAAAHGRERGHGPRRSPDRGSDPSPEKPGRGLQRSAESAARLGRDGSGRDGDGDAAADDRGESFITAVILDIPDDDSVLRLIDCGHPPPMLLNADGITVLNSRHPAPPLGLGELAPVKYEVEVFPFLPGDRLLIYTDGVIEARDPQRRFYPLTERVAAWRSERPQVLLNRLRRDLLAHVGGRLDDDAAMVLVERLPRRG